MLSEMCAFLPCCWGLGGQKLPLGTWDVQFGIPSAEPALDGAWGVTPAAFPGDGFGAPAAPGCEQCCGSWSRLERQLCPAQKVCEKSRCCLS